MKFEQLPQVNAGEAEKTQEKERGLFEDSLKRLPEIMAYITALAGSGGIAQAQDIQANKVEAGVHVERNLEVDQISRERFGASIYDECERLGCEVIMEKPSANGKYIIHMAQVHTRGPREDSLYDSAMSVAKSQTVIFNFINNIQSPTIVDEGAISADVSIYRPETSFHSFGARYNQTKASIESGDPSSMYSGQRETINYQILRSDARDKGYEMLSEEYNSELLDKNIFTQAERMSADPEYRATIIETAGEASVKSINDFAVNYKKPLKYTAPLVDVRHRTLVAVGAAKMALMDGKNMRYLPGDDGQMLIEGNRLISEGKFFSQEFYDTLRKRNRVALQSAVESNDTMPIVIYGAAHEFAPDLNGTQLEYGVVRIKTGVGKLHEFTIKKEDSGQVVYSERDKPLDHADPQMLVDSDLKVSWEVIEQKE